MTIKSLANFLFIKKIYNITHSIVFSVCLFSAVETPKSHIFIINLEIFVESRICDFSFASVQYSAVRIIFKLMIHIRLQTLYSKC